MDYLSEEWLLAIAVEKYEREKPADFMFNQTDLCRYMKKYLWDDKTIKLKSSVNSLAKVFTDARNGKFTSLSPQGKGKDKYFLEFVGCHSMSQFLKDIPRIDTAKIEKLYHFLGVDRIESIKDNTPLGKSSTIDRVIFDRELTPIYRVADCIDQLPDELDRIDKAFASNKVVTMNGIGGIGKSTLANIYLHKNIESYDHIAWLSVKEYDHLYDPGNSKALYEAVYALGIKLRVPFSLSPEDRFLECMSSLLRIEGTNLLVIDNAGPALAKYWNYLNAPNWQILIVSRYNFPNSKDQSRIELNGYPFHVALKIFRLFSGETTGEADAKEEKLLCSILDSCNGHPLLIMLLANLRKQNDLSMAELHRVLTKQGLLIGSDFAVHIDAGIVDPESYITRLFPLFNVPEPVLKLLCFFSIMPNFTIPLNHIRQLSWDEEIQKTLLETYTFGWVTKAMSSTIGATYGMHSLVKEVISRRYPPTFEQVQYMINGVLNGMAKLVGQKDELVDKKELIEYAVAIFYVVEKSVQTPTLEYVTFVNTIANRYGKDIKDYESAFKYSDVALDMNERLYRDNPDQQVIRYLSIIYKNRAMYARGIADMELSTEDSGLMIPAFKRFDEALRYLKKSNEYLNLLADQNRQFTALQNLHEYRSICESIFNHEQTPPDERERKLKELLSICETIAAQHKVIFGESLPVFENPLEFESVVTLVFDNSRWALWLAVANRMDEACTVLENSGGGFRGFLEKMIQLASQNPEFVSLANRRRNLSIQLDGAMDILINCHLRIKPKLIKENSILSENFAWLTDRLFYFIRLNLLNHFEQVYESPDELRHLKKRSVQEIDNLIPYCEKVYGMDSALVVRLKNFRNTLTAEIK